MGKELAEIIEENGIMYRLAEDGCYYPDLRMLEGTHYNIGKYGFMRWEYLLTNCKSEYIRLLLEGKLNEYLHEVDEECHARVELLVEQMKAGAGITEELKVANHMKWVGLMNNVRITAEEIVQKEIICELDMYKKKLICPECGFGRLIDADKDTKSELREESKIEAGWHPDCFAKCSKCGKQIAIRKVG